MTKGPVDVQSPKLNRGMEYILRKRQEDNFLFSIVKKVSLFSREINLKIELKINKKIPEKHPL
jgi:hypothetical protein